MMKKVKLIMENRKSHQNVGASFPPPVMPWLLIIVVRVGPQQRTQHLFNQVKVYLVKFSLTAQ